MPSPSCSRMARMMADYMRQVSPEMAAALIDERDEHMVSCLAGLTGRVVGVVGLAHLEGMEQRWQAMQHGEEMAVARLGT